MKDCKHMNFEVAHKVGRLTDEKNPEKVNAFMFDAKVRCLDCGLPFEFVGLPGGMAFDRPMVNFDATELRQPIRPSSDPAEQVKSILK